MMECIKHSILPELVQCEYKLVSIIQTALEIFLPYNSYFWSSITSIRKYGIPRCHYEVQFTYRKICISWNAPPPYFRFPPNISLPASSHRTNTRPHSPNGVGSRRQERPGQTPAFAKLPKIIKIKSHSLYCGVQSLEQISSSTKGKLIIPDGAC